MRFTSDPWCPHSLEDTTSKTDVGHPDELMAETVEAGMQGVENHMFIFVYHLFIIWNYPLPRKPVTTTTMIHS